MQVSPTFSPSVSHDLWAAGRSQPDRPTQAPDSPTPVPYSFSTYSPPPDLVHALAGDRSRLILRLVGSHPLWGHHLSAPSLLPPLLSW